MATEVNITPYDILLATVSAQLFRSAQIADTCRDFLRPSLIWTARSLQVEPSLHCIDLCKGSYGAAIEGVSLISFGLVRPAILSLRAHYELSLQFLYYRDHPVEWRNVTAYRSQPNLPGVNKKYLRDFYPYYEKRIGRLSKVKESSVDDCYEVLSGVAHGTALDSISSATEPKDLVESKTVVSSAAAIFQSVGETLFDTHVAAWESNWVSLPEIAKELLERRFKDKNPKGELEL